MASIGEKCFDILGILKMAIIKSVEVGSNSFSVNSCIYTRKLATSLKVSVVFKF